MIVLYIILGFIGLFLLLQFSMVIKMRMQKGKDAPMVNGRAGKITQNGKAALLYFFSPGCRACRDMTPVVQSMARKNPQVLAIDVSKDMDIARKFGIMGTPSTVLVESGKIKEFLVGAQPESRLQSLLTR